MLEGSSGVYQASVVITNPCLCLLMFRRQLSFMSFIFLFFSWSGSAFVRNGQCGPVEDGFLNLMKAISALLFAGMNLGQVSIFLPSIAKSRVAATQIFRLLDRQSKIDS